jgi:hypothetical protein
MAETEEGKMRGKMRHCFCCGKAIGSYVEWDPLDTCGDRECDREARNVLADEREAAHEKLDRDRGWR